MGKTSIWYRFKHTTKISIIFFIFMVILRPHLNLHFYNFLFFYQIFIQIHWNFTTFGKQHSVFQENHQYRPSAPQKFPQDTDNMSIGNSTSVSFETKHLKVRFEYWTIFKGYLQAKIFEKQLWTFGQKLIFNEFTYIFKIKDKIKVK